MAKKQVLIIDDDHDTATFFGVIMDLIGLDSEFVYSARSALNRLAGSAPDIILLDMRLGSDIGGEEILYQIRSNPRFDATHVVIITAYPSTIDNISELADLILVKPVEVEQLKAMIAGIAEVDDFSRVMIFRDPITQFFTKAFFMTRLELALERRRRRPDFLFAVFAFTLYLAESDITMLGSERQTAFLREFSHRLRSQLRPIDTIAQVSNIKFYTLHEEIHSPDNVAVIINRIQDILAEPFMVGSQSILVKAHFGVMVSGEEHTDPEGIINAVEKSLQSLPFG